MSLFKTSSKQHFDNGKIDALLSQAVNDPSITDAPDQPHVEQANTSAPEDNYIDGNLEADASDIFTLPDTTIMRVGQGLFFRDDGDGSIEISQVDENEQWTTLYSGTAQDFVEFAAGTDLATLQGVFGDATSSLVASVIMTSNVQTVQIQDQSLRQGVIALIIDEKPATNTALADAS